MEEKELDNPLKAFDKIPDKQKDEISDEMLDQIQKILRQTNYTEIEAYDKLKEHNFDYLAVVKAYFGINDKNPKVKSINQEIYKQLRYKLDGAMSNYNNKLESNI
jgi:uncharacterized protein YabN with tetrapyrrole methylase and pyrophosphatase domain